ncbi:ATP-binding cassette domain-containing protein [Vibrio sp.]|uniref:ABC transporter ATP-binding protein n=1 Tax=Vibrio sp. TaxID=678 RepID=UPI003D11B977
MTNAIRVEDLTKIYGNPETGVLAVDHINFTVEQGEIFGFLGPNGAGKTTTQRMLTTLLEPTSGRIWIHDNDLAKDDYPAKKIIGLVPEESNVYLELSAWDNLMFTASIYLVPKNDRASRATDLLKMFGLYEKREIKAENYSKGMRRRLSIAMAIIHKPSLLFLDEATTGLDALSTREIRNLIRQLNDEGTTVFMTTHLIEEANQLCDRVAIINHGKIATIDTPENLKKTLERVQSVVVALEPDGQSHGDGLKTLPGVINGVKMGDKWRLYAEDPSDLLPRIMEYANSHDLRIVSLNTLAPSLEDVYLEITGGEVGSVESNAAGNTSNKRKMRG